ncbi:MAG: DUF1934 domain-containing protein [Oscillospiraceae bacterium]|jgi:uncharacterized beta-barrel protein YwiB (DUF1934 family)|nr:DUF1934 domain-containing protein [Oscillospiraceae bacterium]
MKVKDVIISIKGTQNDSNGEDDVVELETDGVFSFENGEGMLSYMESELTGLNGTKTSFTISPMGVVMTREGGLNSRMVFEKGRKHNFLYETPFGSATMGVNTTNILVDFNEHGGDMEIDYIVDFQHSVVGHNMFRIKVSEQRKA